MRSATWTDALMRARNAGSVLAAVVALLSASPALGQAAAASVKARHADQLFADKHFKEAIAGYGEAYSISGDPTYLYRRGRAHRLVWACTERAGERAEAIEDFRRYLRESPPRAEDREMAKELAEELERGVAPQNPDCPDPASVDAPATPLADPPEPTVPYRTPVDRPTPAVPKDDPGEGRRFTGGVIGGLALVFVAVGAVQAWRADAKWNDARTQFCGPESKDCESDANELKDLNTYRNAFLGIGAATGVIAAIIYFTAPERSDAAQSVAIAPTADGFLVGASRRF